jgi:hypothetical protein
MYELYPKITWVEIIISVKSKNGDPRGVRTPDLYPVKVALSQLSYRISIFAEQLKIYDRAFSLSIKNWIYEPENIYDPSFKFMSLQKNLRSLKRFYEPLKFFMVLRIYL